MGISLTDAKKLLGEKAYLQAKKQLDIAKNKGKASTLKTRERNPAEEGLEYLLKLVFEPDFPVEREVTPLEHRKYRVDFLVTVNNSKYIFEVDGWQYHGKYKKDFYRDREKDLEMFLAGINTIRIPAGEVLTKQDVALEK